MDNSSMSEKKLYDKDIVDIHSNPFTAINKEDLMSDDFLYSIKYKVVERKYTYGKAISMKDGGMTILTWNTNGSSINYFGEPLQPNINIGIKKDGGTRTTFHGVIYSLDQLKLILELVQ